MSKAKDLMEADMEEAEEVSDNEVEQEQEETKAVEETEEDTSLANSDVTTKYQEAAKIANTVLRELIAVIIPGTSVLDICKTGDKLIEEKLSLVYRGKGKNGKPVDKGIAFPVCISLNEVVCHYSPLDSDVAVPILAENDLVKIDLGVHVDGYIAVVAHTMLCKAPTTSTASASASVSSGEDRITGPCANVINAAYTAAEVACRLIRPTNTNQQVTNAITKVAETYGVRAITGSIMHQMKRYVIDGNKRIAVSMDALDKKNPDKIEPCIFEPYEVYGVDIAFSTGEGKPKDKGERTTVYKRIIDKKYSLKVKASRTFFNEVNKRFPTFPFSLRYITDEKSARLGLRECVQHELLVPYPVIVENKGDFIAHFKFTVLVLPTRTSKVTGIELPEGMFVSSESIKLPEDIVAILAMDDGSNKKKKKPAKKLVVEKEGTA